MNFNFYHLHNEGVNDYDEFNLPQSESERIITAVQLHNEILHERIPFYYGSHYFNPIYIIHFLVRLLSYSQTMIEMQGNRFDEPERLFLSLASTIQSITSQNSDVRELCSEFYYLPELFTNINNLNFGKLTTTNDEVIRVDDVVLPQWTNNNKYYLVNKNKVTIEKQVNVTY